MSMPGVPAPGDLDNDGGEQGLPAVADRDSERPAEVTMRQNRAADY